MKKISYDNKASLKKYTLPIILLIVVVYYSAFYPEFSGIIKFLQYTLYFSMVSILVSKMAITSKPEIKLLKWTFAIGLVLPISLADVHVMNIDPMYLATMIILVPISFHELFKVDSAKEKSIELQRCVSFKALQKKVISLQNFVELTLN